MGKLIAKLAHMRDQDDLNRQGSNNSETSKRLLFIRVCNNEYCILIINRLLPCSSNKTFRHAAMNDIIIGLSPLLVFPHG